MFGLVVSRRMTMATVATTSRCSCTPSSSSPQIVYVRHATKKAGGSSNNGRDSAGRRLGIKVWPGTLAKPGSIIVRQRGEKFLVGTNTGMGKDHTIFALAAGRVELERSTKNRKRNIVHVIPVGGDDVASIPSSM